MVLPIHVPARFFPCSGVSIMECKSLAQRTITTGSETFIGNVFADEPSCEVAFRGPSDGSETDVRSAIALRTHPLQIGVRLRNVADGLGPIRRPPSHMAALGHCTGRWTVLSLRGRRPQQMD